MKVSHPAGVRIATLSGAAFRLEPGEIRDLPPHLATVALGHGAHIVEDDSEPQDAATQTEVLTTVEVPHVVVKTPQPTDHERLVIIMKDIIERGQKDEFRSDGEPKAAILNRLFGKVVTEELRTAAWAEATKVV